MDKTQLKIDNSRFRKQCQERVTRSKLPNELKQTLQVLLSYVGPASHYTLCWASVQTIAATVGVEPRAVERPLQILDAVRLIKRDIKSVADARRQLKGQFDHDLKCGSTWAIALTSINREHPFCQNGDLGDLLGQIKRAANVTRLGRRKGAQGVRDSGTGDAEMVTPVTPQMVTPVSSESFQKEREPTHGPASPEPTEPGSPEQSGDEIAGEGSLREPSPGASAPSGLPTHPDPATELLDQVRATHPLAGLSI